MTRALALVLLATPAAAQSLDPAPWRQAFLDCVAAATESADLEACRGLVSNRCSEETEGGWSNLGMTACIRAEGRLWDDLLNADWPGHKAWAEAGDAADAAHFGDQFSGRAESLLAAQRAWLAFRDAQCALDHASWGSGSMRHPIAAGCITDMTADRVIALRALTQDF